MNEINAEQFLYSLNLHFESWLELDFTFLLAELRITRGLESWLELDFTFLLAELRITRGLES
jgi:hypothetical protein